MASNVKFTRLSSLEDEDESHPDLFRARLRAPWWRVYGLYILLTASLVLNALLLEKKWLPPLSTHRTPETYAVTDHLPTSWAHFEWNSAYSPANHNDSEHLWDAILPSHGIIAVDRHLASERRWPESMYLPSDHSKGVYLLEAYHQLHCIKILRKTFWEAVESRPFTHPPSSHMEHCFDALRQAAICNADNTPLYTFGDFTAGDGQVHKCRDWEALRQYATDNTACFRDSVEPIALGDHFGYCDDGDDGVRGLKTHHI